MFVVVEGEFQERESERRTVVTGGYAKSRQIKQNNMIDDAKADAEASAKWLPWYTHKSCDAIKKKTSTIQKGHDETEVS